MRRPAVTVAERPARGVAQVAGSAPERVSEVVADDGGGTARPEQEAHHEAHRTADADVLDPQQADLPAGRDQQVEEHDDRDREGGLPDDEWRCAGRVRRDQYGYGEGDPQPGGAGADANEQGGANGETRDRAGQAAQRSLTGGGRARPQHREGPEDNPERMLDVGDLGYGHRGGQRDGAPGTVAEPDRPQASVASDYSGRAQEPRRRLGCRRAPSGDHRLAQGGRDGYADGLGVEGVVSAPDGDRGIVAELA